MKNFYFILLPLLFFNCSNNDDDSVDNCIEFHPARIEEVSPAITIDAAGYPFTVGFRVFNGCGEFGSFVETKEGNEITIEVIAKYEGCICTQDAPLRETVYVFNETNSGTYTLKFKKLDESYITETIVIE